MTEKPAHANSVVIVSFDADGVASVLRHALCAKAHMKDIHREPYARAEPDEHAHPMLFLGFDPVTEEVMLSSSGYYPSGAPGDASEQISPVQMHLRAPAKTDSLIEALRNKSVFHEDVPCGFVFGIHAGDVLDVMREHHRFVVFEIREDSVRYYGVPSFNTESLKFT